METMFITVFIGMTLYLLISIYLCHRNAKDVDVLKTYKPSSKKVKDMTKQQKQYRKRGQDAKFRQHFYTCGYWQLKMILLVSATFAYLLYPYAKEKKTIGYFVALWIVSIPVLLFSSGVLMISVHLLSTSNRSL